MEPKFENRLAVLEEKIDKIFVSVEKTRKYFLWIFWITIAMVVLPMIGLIFAIPAFISTYASLDGLM